MIYSSKTQIEKYFDGAEVQYENSCQQETIIRALNDILTLPEKELKTKKYPDYKGKEESWDIPKLISSYFVPDDPRKTWGEDMYKELKANEVEEIFKNILETLTKD